MRLLIALAAVLTSAALTVPTLAVTGAVGRKNGPAD